MVVRHFSNAKIYNGKFFEKNKVENKVKKYFEYFSKRCMLFRRLKIYFSLDFPNANI